jgi:hypothetical protein
MRRKWAGRLVNVSFLKLAFWAFVGVISCYCAMLPKAKGGEQDHQESQKRIAYLIEMLASKNAAPPILGDASEGDDQVVGFPENYDKSLQVPVYLATQQLLAEGEVAFDQLLAHLEDKRYSFSVNSLNDYNNDVSDACEEILWRIVLGYESELHVITRLQFGLYPSRDDRAKMADFFKKQVKQKGLVAIQLGAIDATIAFMENVDGKTAPPWHPEAEQLPIKKFDRLRDENLKKLKGIRQAIVQTGRPYIPRTLFDSPRQFFGLPWSSRKWNK